MTSGAGAAFFPPFRPRAPWWGADLQTLRNMLVRRPDPLAGWPGQQRLDLPMPDGSGDRLVGHLARPPAPPPAVLPLAVLIHGLTGSADSTYVQMTAARLLADGFTVLRLTLRGAGETRALCRQRYHAGRSGDLRAVLAQLDPGALPETTAGVVLAGYSLGGNMLLKFLGENDFPLPVRAAVAVSAPIDLAATARRFEAPRNLVYQHWMVRQMQVETLAGPLSDAERRTVAAVTTVRQFDDRFVAPRNGWRDADDYYRVNSALGFLPRIRVPTLVIHAQDDPWIPVSAYQGFPWAGHPALTLLLPRQGGHVGFHGDTGQGRWPWRAAGPQGRLCWPWHDECITGYFLANSRAASTAP